MKRIFFIIIALLTVVGIASAQNREKRGPNPKMWQEIQEFKMKFLAQEMELKKDQQQQFFDLYSEMSEKKRVVFDEMRRTQREIDKKEDATDKDYEEATAKINNLREKMSDIDKEYNAKFSKFLTQRQIYKMNEGEEKFREKMSKMHYGGKHRKRHGGENSDKIKK